MDKKELLIQAWKEVFEVDEVAEDADFFAEGGDSIKAVQLSSWLLQKGIKLDLGQIFYKPVLSQMAEILEDVDPVYVPEELATKELVGEKLNAIMTGQTFGKGQARQPVAAQTGEDQRICDPETMAAQTGEDQRVCDPETMTAQTGEDQRVCDPETMTAQTGEDQRVCDPQTMAAQTRSGLGQVGAASEFHVMMAMFQTILSQQQVMLQMMQVMISRMMAPAPFYPAASFSGTRPQTRPGMDFKTWAGLPEGTKRELQKLMAQYRSHKVEKPIEKPNVIKINPAKVKKAEYSAEEVLDHVLSGLFKREYSKTEDLFEQGLTSLDTVKMVTRCGENGYSLTMQDIYMHPTFEELVACMKPGK